MRLKPFLILPTILTVTKIAEKNKIKHVRYSSIVIIGNRITTLALLIIYNFEIK